MSEAHVTVEGAATGQVSVDPVLGAVVVEAQHGGILKLRFTNAGKVVNAQRTIVVRPWSQASLEGAMFSLDSGETLQLKETGLLSRFAFEQGGLVLSFSDQAIHTFAKGGLLTLIDYYR